jgi:hypothetical protein
VRLCERIGYAHPSELCECVAVMCVHATCVCHSRNVPGAVRVRAWDRGGEHEGAPLGDIVYNERTMRVAIIPAPAQPAEATTVWLEQPQRHELRSVARWLIVSAADEQWRQRKDGPMC